MRHLATLLFAVFLAIASAGSAQVEKPRGCSIREARNDDGWVVPGVTDRPITVGEQATAGVNSGLSSRNIPAKRGLARITVVDCVNGDPTKIWIHRESVEVLSATEYSFNSRRFAYLVLFGETAMEGGKPVRVGSAIRTFFYDPDGSGLFKIQLDASEVGFAVVIPGWVKRLPAGGDRGP